MRQQGGHFCPLHFGAWHQVALKIVGVHIDKAGHQVVALKIPTIGMPGGAWVHRSNPALNDRDAAQHDLVRQNQLGIFKNKRVHTGVLN